MQLTKDLVPVIYHDFLVSETGIDAPVHTLTLEQVSNHLVIHFFVQLLIKPLKFLHISDQIARGSKQSSSQEDAKDDVEAIPGKPQARRPRAYSLGNNDKGNNSGMQERMKHTRDFKMKGFKGNSRGDFIQAPFTTLEEMLRKLPESIGFNIEMSESPCLISSFSVRTG